MDVVITGDWLDPNWRHNLSNSVIAWIVVAVLAAVLGALWWGIKRLTPPSLGDVASDPISITAFNSIRDITLTNQTDSVAYANDVLVNLPNGSTRYFHLGLELSPKGVHKKVLPGPNGTPRTTRLLGNDWSAHNVKLREVVPTKCIQIAIFSLDDPEFRQFKDFYEKRNEQLGFFPSKGVLHYQIAGQTGIKIQMVTVAVLTLVIEECLQ